MVPVFTMYCKFEGLDSGEGATIRATNASGSGLWAKFRQGNKVAEQLYETYLDGVEFSTSAGRSSFADGGIKFEAKVSGGANGVDIYPDTTWLLEYEVI